MSDRMPKRLCSEDPDRGPPEGDVVEMPLLLPGWQVSVLETAAHDRGLTAAQMLRSLLRDFISGLDRPPPASRSCARNGPTPCRPAPAYSLEPAMRPPGCRHHPGG
jgi:hypothetical protein